MNCISHYSWKSQSLEITHGNRLSLSLPVLTTPAHTLTSPHGVVPRLTQGHESYISGVHRYRARFYEIREADWVGYHLGSRS
jgi:hypothetical protein